MKFCPCARFQTSWVRVMRLFGITTYYKVEEGNRCLFVKMEGEMEDLSVLQLAAVIREIDLFKTWMPFCCDAVPCTAMQNLGMRTGRKLPAAAPVASVPVEQHCDYTRVLAESES